MNRLTKVCKNGFVTLDTAAYSIDQSVIDTVIRNSEPIKAAVAKLKQYEDAEQALEESKSNLTPIEEMDLSARTYNCLKRVDIDTLQDLSKRTENDLMKIRNFGVRCLKEVVEKCKLYGVEIIPESEGQ